MSHSLTKILIHCIFSTEGRRELLKGEISTRINAYMAGVARNHGGHLIRAGGTADHRHLLLAIEPTTCVADLVRFIKANSSKWLHETYPQVGRLGWQTGYAAFSVSESIRPRVVAYIDGQEEHHRRMTFEEELRAILSRHGVSLDTADALE